MKTKKQRVPFTLPIIAVVALGLGLAAQPLVASLDEQQIARNVIIAAVPFILIFVAILLVFIWGIWLASARLSDEISPEIYRPIERFIIGGIILGVLFMFQPWIFALFKLGFFILLFSTLAFIVWSHIRPRVDMSGEEFDETQAV